MKLLQSPNEGSFKLQSNTRNGTLPIVVTGDVIKEGGKAIGKIVNAGGECFVVLTKEIGEYKRTEIQQKVSAYGIHISDVMHEREWRVHALNTMRHWDNNDYNSANHWAYEERSRQSRHGCLKTLGITGVLGATLVGGIKACQPTVEKLIRLFITTNFQNTSKQYLVLQ